MDPHIAVHGSFSLMVNYHAIGAWFTSRGGFALHNPQEEASLKVSAFVLSADTEAVGGACGDWASSDAFSYRDEARAARYPHLLQAFSEAVDTFGPNDFFVLQKSIKEDLANPPLRTVYQHQHLPSSLSSSSSSLSSSSLRLLGLLVSR